MHCEEVGMQITIHVTGPVTVHSGLSDEDRDFIRESLTMLLKGQSTMSLELDNLTREVSETNDVIQSAIVLIQGLKAALDAAGTDPVALAALSASLDSQQQALAAAIAANTPAAPVV
jgi:hypothetical protein